VLHAYGRADVRRRLVESNALGFETADEVDVVVVVADELKEKDLLLSDSQTIATCLLVRDVQADHRENRDVSLADLSVLSLEALQVACPMTAEILDVATRATIEENPAIKAIADFIVVNDLAARLIAAVADRREVASVLGQLLGPDPKSQVASCLHVCRFLSRFIAFARFVALPAARQDIFVVEASALLYPNELVAARAAACVDVGDAPPRSEAALRKHARAHAYTPPERVHERAAAHAAQNPTASGAGTALDGASAPPFSPPPRSASGRGTGPPPAGALRAKSSWVYNSSARNSSGGDDDEDGSGDDESDKARPVRQHSEPFDAFGLWMFAPSLGASPKPPLANLGACCVPSQGELCRTRVARVAAAAARAAAGLREGHVGRQERPRRGPLDGVQPAGQRRAAVLAPERLPARHVHHGQQLVQQHGHAHGRALTSCEKQQRETQCAVGAETSKWAVLL
jgi:hypothetical protein